MQQHRVRQLPDLATYQAIYVMKRGRFDADAVQFGRATRLVARRSEARVLARGVRLGGLLDYLIVRASTGSR